MSRRPIYDSAMDRLLLILPSATYRAPDFMAAARELGVAVTVASERRAAMSAAMGERALTLRAVGPGEWRPSRSPSVPGETPFAAIVGVDDQGVMAAALGAERLGLPHNPPASRRPHARQGGDAPGARGGRRPAAALRRAGLRS